MPDLFQNGGFQMDRRCTGFETGFEIMSECIFFLEKLKGEWIFFYFLQKKLFRLFGKIAVQVHLNFSQKFSKLWIGIWACAVVFGSK